MRLVSFDAQRVGVIRDDAVIDLSDLVDAPGTWPPADMVRLIANFGGLRAQVDDRLANEQGIPLHEVRLGPPIQWPNKLVAFPTNYEDHIREMNSANRADRNGFFLKASSSISGPRDAIELPLLAEDRDVHHEAELGVVLGRTGRNVPADEAYDYVFGYTCLLDMTVRGTGERVMRKSFDTFTPIGPAIVTADEVPEPGNLNIELRVNGEVRQRGNTGDLILGICEMVEMISSVATIYPGDLIATGTPGGVGPVRPGDEVTVRIDHLGELSVPVVQGASGRNVALGSVSRTR